jgi:hypothetical protein
MGLFNRTAASSPATLTQEPKSESTPTDIATAENAPRKRSLPRYNSNGHRVTKYIHPDGESGRKGNISLPRDHSKYMGMAYPRECFVPARSQQDSRATYLFLLLLKMCRRSSIPFRPGRLEKLMYSVQVGQLALAFRSRCLCPPFRTSRAPHMDLRHQLHRNGPCSKSHRLRWSRIGSKDAESVWYTG